MNYIIYGKFMPILNLTFRLLLRSGNLFARHIGQREIIHLRLLVVGEDTIQEEPLRGRLLPSALSLRSISTRSVLFFAYHLLLLLSSPSPSVGSNKSITTIQYPSVRLFQIST